MFTTALLNRILHHFLCILGPTRVREPVGERVRVQETGAVLCYGRALSTRIGGTQRHFNIYSSAAIRF